MLPLRGCLLWICRKVLFVNASRLKAGRGIFVAWLAGGLACCVLASEILPQVVRRF